MSLDDILEWPDGEWCYRDELVGFSHKSDDYRVISVDTDEWHTFVDKD